MLFRSAVPSKGPPSILYFLVNENTFRFIANFPRFPSMFQVGTNERIFLRTVATWLVLLFIRQVGLRRENSPFASYSNCSEESVMCIRPLSERSLLLMTKFVPIVYPYNEANVHITGRCTRCSFVRRFSAQRCGACNGPC